MSSRGKKNTHTLGIPTKGSCSEEKQKQNIWLKDHPKFLDATHIFYLFYRTTHPNQVYFALKTKITTPFWLYDNEMC